MSGLITTWIHCVTKHNTLFRTVSTVGVIKVCETSWIIEKNSRPMLPLFLPTNRSEVLCKPTHVGVLTRRLSSLNLKPSLWLRMKVQAP